MVARNVETSVGEVTTVVCENYEGGTGRVHEIVVFGKCTTSVGGADVVHLLHSTEVEEGTGDVGEYDYCDAEKLLALAYRLSHIEPPRKAKQSGTISIGGTVSDSVFIQGDGNTVKKTRW